MAKETTPAALATPELPGLKGRGRPYFSGFVVMWMAISVTSRDVTEIARFFYLKLQ